MKSHIPIILKKYRELNNLSQAQVAKYLEIGSSAYNHYESGAREPGVAVLTKLAKLYNLEDQILGVNSLSFDDQPLSLNEYTAQDLYDRIENANSLYTLYSNRNNQTYHLFQSQFDALCSFFSDYREYKKTVFKDIISPKTKTDEKIYKALTYAWLERQSIDFQPQVLINAKDCLKSNNYHADGILDDSVIFDIKPLTISQVAIEDNNPYKWAMENQFYFFHDASRFCINHPYIIICPFFSKTSIHFSNSFTDSTLTAFRSLCRRIFLGMPSDTYVEQIDQYCPPLINMNSASQCLSGIIFQEISMQPDKDHLLLFLNPNARNVMPHYISDQFRFLSQSIIEDYSFDNY